MVKISVVGSDVLPNNSIYSIMTSKLMRTNSGERYCNIGNTSNSVGNVSIRSNASAGNASLLGANAITITSIESAYYVADKEYQYEIYFE